MPFIPAKCPECGGLIEVDDQKKAAVCQHCGAAFVVQDAITNYNTTYTTVHNYGEGSTVNIIGAEDSIDKLLSSAEAAYKIGNYSLAQEKYETISQKYPDDPRGWWGMIVSGTDGFTNIDVDYGVLNQYFGYVQKLCQGKEEYPALEKQYSDFLMLRAKVNAEQQVNEWKQYKGELETGLARADSNKKAFVDSRARIDNTDAKYLKELEEKLEQCNNGIEYDNKKLSTGLILPIVLLCVSVVLFCLAGGSADAFWLLLGGGVCAVATLLAFDLYFTKRRGYKIDLEHCIKDKEEAEKQLESLKRSIQSENERTQQGMKEHEETAQIIQDRIGKVDRLVSAERGDVETLMHIFLCKRANIPVEVDADINDLWRRTSEVHDMQQDGVCPLCGTALSVDGLYRKYCERCGYGKK